MLNQYKISNFRCSFPAGVA